MLTAGQMHDQPQCSAVQPCSCSLAASTEESNQPHTLTVRGTTPPAAPVHAQEGERRLRHDAHVAARARSGCALLHMSGRPSRCHRQSPPWQSVGCTCGTAHPLVQASLWHRPTCSAAPGDAPVRLSSRRPCFPCDTSDADGRCRRGVPGKEEAFGSVPRDRAATFGPVSLRGAAPGACSAACSVT